MFLIMSSLNKDLIMAASPTISYEDNENVLVNPTGGFEYAIPKIFYSKVVEYKGDFNFDEFIDGKYVYSAKNNSISIDPNWVDPAQSQNRYGLPDEQVQEIKDDTVAELIELGVL